jgi:RNA polymerase sigma-70 factor (ECF subfamily)
VPVVDSPQDDAPHGGGLSGTPPDGAPCPPPAGSDGLPALLEHDRRRLYRFARQLTRDHAEAEDLVQESLMTAWRKRELYEGRGSVAGFLRSTAFRLFLNQREKDQRRDRIQPMTVLGDPPSPGSRQDDVARADALAYFVARVREALETLPREQREAFVLFRFDGLTCAEIALRTHAPVKTVETRVRRATLALAEELRGYRDLLVGRS